MPEGDTIWRTARTLHAALAGKTVVAFDSVLPAVVAASRRHTLVRLGPDLLGSGFDPVAACRRLRERGDLEIGPALMDQTAVSGIGNVYKSEVLFLCGVSPFTRVRDVDEATIDRLVAKAGDLLRRNLGPGLRRTTTALAPGRL